MPDDYDKMQFMEGMSQFQSARMRAFWDDVKNLVQGKPAELLSFEDVRTRLRLREEYYKGLQDIPLDKIVGSVGRYQEFTRNFLPKRRVQQERWSRVYAQATGMMGLPPIEVYKVGDVYFVRDGNHRVSVARRLGAEYIQAHVTELPTSIALKPDTDESELDALAAYAQFLDETRLPMTRPHHQSLMLSEPSRYTEMLGHINVHMEIMRKRMGDWVDFEEAAADWYDNVFRPAVTLIRKYNVLSHTPKRTEADLYLWMIDHLREVQEELGDEAEAPRTFSDALEDYLSERHVEVPQELREEKDQTVTLTRADIASELAEYRAKITAEQARAGSATRRTSEFPPVKPDADPALDEPANPAQHYIPDLNAPSSAGWANNK